MPKPLLLSIVEMGGYPNFTPLSDEIIVIDPNDVRIVTNPNESNN